MLAACGGNWRPPEDMLPVPCAGTLCFRNTPGALVRCSGLVRKPADPGGHDPHAPRRTCRFQNGPDTPVSSGSVNPAAASGPAPQARLRSHALSGFQPATARLSVLTTNGDSEMVGHPGVAPGVSPIRTARIAVFLVPDEMVEPRGIAPRSTQCHCVVLLLDDGPEMERAPGLAPGKSGFASRRLDDFGIARVCEVG